MISSDSFIRPDEFWQTVGLRAGQTVAHLGCGPGFYLIPAAKIVGKTGKVIGIDVLTHLLEEVESRAMRDNVTDIISTIRADLEQEKGSTLSDGQVDHVLIANILHQANPEKILSEARRIVKDDGVVTIVEWNTSATPLGPPIDKRISQDEVIDIAKKQGLVEKKKFSPSPYHYGLVLSPT